MELREALNRFRELNAGSAAAKAVQDVEKRLDSLPAQMAVMLAGFRGRVDEDDEYELSEGEAAATFRLIEELRSAADEHERALLRHLKWGGEGMTWEEVSEAVDGQLGGRAAMQKRWSRLTSRSRRTTTGNMRRGAADPTVRRSTVSGVDTTTPTE